MSNTVTIVCLHGWGGSPESFTELRAACNGLSLTILTPSLPGFDKSIIPEKPLTMDEYAQWLELQISSIPNGSKIILLGHSHGGRTIAHWLLSSEYKHSKVSHVIWCAPAVIANKQTYKKKIGYLGAKVGNAIFSIPGLCVLKKPARTLLYKILRVHDYEQASPVMKQTMQNVISKDYAEDLNNITIPIDLFWGTEDTLTPYSDALIIHKELPNSVLHTIPGIRHAVHRHAADQIATTITQFIND